MVKVISWAVWFAQKGWDEIKYNLVEWGLIAGLVGIVAIGFCVTILPLLGDPQMSVAELETGELVMLKRMPWNGESTIRCMDGRRIPLERVNFIREGDFPDD